MTPRRADIAAILRQRLLSGLHLGELKHGQRLPSARDLARELGSDPRVILAAYRRLETEGLVELRPRSGIFVVTHDARESGLRRRTHDWMVEILLEAVRRGIPAPEFPERLRESLKTLRLRAACIECNDDLVDELSSEVHSTYGLDVSGVTVDGLSASPPPKDVQGADLLITTLFHTRQVQPWAIQLGKPWIVAELRMDIFAEVARRLTYGPVYHVVADPRFAEKLDLIFGSLPGAANLRVLILGRDDPDQIPETAPVYLTRLARERLPEGSRLKRVIPQARAFTPDTARQIFTFILRANLAALVEAPA